MRPAQDADAEAISRMLGALVAARMRTSGSDVGFVRDAYILHPDRIQCFLAEGDGGGVLGFQSLRRATAGNEFGVQSG